MRRVLMCLAFLGLIASVPAAAQTRLASSKNPAASVTKSPSKAKPAPAQKTEQAAEEKNKTEVMAELQQLRQILLEQNREMEAQRALLQEQQRRMQELERHVAEQGAASATNGAAAEAARAEDLKLVEGQLEAVADSQKELGDRVRTVQTDITNTNRANDGRFRQLGNFRFSGDVRFRYEPFVQEGQTTRQRQRLRVRVNLQGNVTDTIFGGVTIATGTIFDPISTNETLSGFFNRKNVGFDRAWIQWTPKKLLNSHATFGIGKFAYPWIRTPLTFDNDLNPEGLYTRLNWDLKHPVFKGVTIVSFQLPIFERGGSTSATTGVRADGYDAFLVGGQLQTRWKLGDRVTLGTHIAALNFVNADFIALAHAAVSSVATLTNTATGNQPVTNCVRTNASSQVVGYCSRFTYLDWVTTLGVNTGYARWPVNLTLDFNNNVRATRIVQMGTAAPTGQVDNPERSAYWAEIQFGRLAERKDIQFGYTFARIERDAVITAFNESDFRSGSNLRQHRLNFNYRWFNNVTLNYALWLGRVANAADPLTGTEGGIAFVPGGKRAITGGSCNTSPFNGCTDNILKRMQFDFIYSF